MVLVAGLLVLAACGKGRRADVIPAGKLETVLYDYHLAQVVVYDMPAKERYKKDLYLEYVYDKHKVSQAEIDSSLAYYARHPEGLSVIYANLAKRIDADLKRLEGEDTPIKMREAMSVVGDSADLWYDLPVVQMTSSPLANSRYFFTVPTDTNFKSNDLIVWSGKAMFLDESIDSLGKYLHLDLKVLYMNDSIQSVDTLLYSSGDFSIGVSDSAVVKSVNGSAYLKSSSSNERLLIMEPALIRYRTIDNSVSTDSALIQPQMQLVGEGIGAKVKQFELEMSREDAR